MASLALEGTCSLKASMSRRGLQAHVMLELLPLLAETGERHTSRNLVRFPQVGIQKLLPAEECLFQVLC